MAKKIADTKKMTHEQWLQLRKSSIGGSDSGSVVGMNQYSSQLTLYADKKGLSKEKETSEAMRLGTDLEAYVAERFCEKTGKKVRNDFFMYADDEYDFLTANVDRRIVGENACLECKTMGSFNGYNLEAGEIPAHYFCQCQHYMMVMGFDMVYLAILVLQRGLYVIEVKRNDEFIKSLREAEIAFWKDYIEKDTMPDADGSDASIETLKELFPEAHKGREITIPNLDHMVQEYKAASEMEKHYKERKLSIQGDICKRLGDAEVGLGVQYGISWKNQSRSSWDMDRLMADHPEINFARYKKTSEYRVFRTNQRKPKKAKKEA